VDKADRVAEQVDKVALVVLVQPARVAQEVRADREDLVEEQVVKVVRVEQAPEVQELAEHKAL
jgi:hypothetical protein